MMICSCSWLTCAACHVEELSTARVGGAVTEEWDHEPPRRCKTACFAGLYGASYIYARVYIGLAHRLFRLGASARRQAERGVLLRGALLQMR